MISLKKLILEPNATTMAAIENADKGIDMHGPFESVEALMEDLNA